MEGKKPQIKSSEIKFPEENNPGPRSSSGIYFQNNSLFIYGGEFSPRNPVDEFMYQFPLNEKKMIKHQPENPPAQRLGHASAGIG